MNVVVIVVNRYISTNRPWHSWRSPSRTFGTLTIPSTRALKRFDICVHQRYNNWYFIITQLLCRVSTTVWPFMATARNLQSEKPFSPSEGILASGCKKNNKYAISGTGNVFLQIAGMTKKKCTRSEIKKNSLINSTIMSYTNITLYYTIARGTWNAITERTENVSDWETIIHKSFAPFRSLKKNKTLLTIRLFVISLTWKKGSPDPSRNCFFECCSWFHFIIHFQPLRRRYTRLPITFNCQTDHCREVVSPTLYIYIYIYIYNYNLHSPAYTHTLAHIVISLSHSNPLKTVRFFENWTVFFI